jgi:hypothetical protein
MSPSCLLPPDALLSLWLIVKSSHQLRCPPLFVAVANHLPPPDALLLRRRCLHCHAAANFIDAPPLPSSLHRRFCLLRRAAVAFIIAPLLIVAPPLPLLLRRRSLPCRAAAPFLVVPPVLPLSTRCRCLCHRAAAPFIVAPPFLPLSSRRRCLPSRAAAAFIVAPPVLPSSSHRRGLHHRATAASLLIVALPLPSLSCRWFCFRRCATAAFLEAMSAVDDCCVTPKFAMIFLSAVTVKLRPFLPVRVPPHASNSSPASPALATRIWMIVE